TNTTLSTFSFDAFVIQNTGLQLVLDLQGSNGDTGTPIIVSPNDVGDTGQKWVIVNENIGVSFQAVDPNRNVWVPSLQPGGLFVGSQYQKTTFFFRVPGDNKAEFQLTTEPNGGLAWQAVNISNSVMLSPVNDSEPNQFWTFGGVLL
ncbi:hypothetical protein K439DRAFT_1630033, partial [Ramaria rubella]